MSFGSSIIITPNTYNAIGVGTYRLSTIQFGQPINDLKIAPGAVNPKTGITTCSISRHAEADFAVSGGGNVRRKSSVILQIAAAEGFTTSTLDGMLAEISTFVDAANLNRILMGES